MSSTGDLHRVRLEGCEVIAAWSVIIATGARYNRLALARLAEFESVGVYYAATQTEAQACSAGRRSSLVGVILRARPRPS
jgi:thioredoxin reductase (NADPH)